MFGPRDIAHTSKIVLICFWVSKQVEVDLWITDDIRYIVDSNLYVSHPPKIMDMEFSITLATIFYCSWIFSMGPTELCVL